MIHKILDLKGGKINADSFHPTFFTDYLVRSQLMQLHLSPYEVPLPRSSAGQPAA
jgi:hypothetical protein